VADDYHVPGIAAFARGTGLSALALVVALLFESGRPAVGVPAVLGRFGATDLAGVGVPGLAAALALTVALCLPLYVSLHAVDVSLVTGAGASAVAPGALLSGPYAPVLFALPALALTWAGYSRARHRGATGPAEGVVAGTAATVGYLAVALLAILPGAVAFGVVADWLLSAVAGGGAGAGAGGVRLVYRNPARAHLVAGVAYPLVFTAAGGLVAGASGGPDDGSAD
jgi:hypothetical protein